MPNCFSCTTRVLRRYQFCFPCYRRVWESLSATTTSIRAQLTAEEARQARYEETMNG